MIKGTYSGKAITFNGESFDCADDVLKTHLNSLLLIALKDTVSVHPDPEGELWKLVSEKVEIKMTSRTDPPESNAPEGAIH